MTSSPSASELKFLQNHSRRIESLQRVKQGKQTDFKNNDEFDWLLTEAKHINVQIDGMLTSVKDTSLVTSAQRYDFEEKLDGIYANIRALEHKFVSLLHNEEMVVANYERKVKDEVQGLLQRLEDVRKTFLPRQRFRFSNRARVRNEKHGKVASVKKAQDFDVCSTLGRCETPPIQTDLIMNQLTIDTRKNILNDGSEDDESGFIHEISDLSDVTIDVNELPFIADIQNSRIHFRMRNLTRCVVIMREIFGAVRMQSLNECTVYCGPVVGPVYVEGCSNSCKIFVAGRQLRIHESYDVDFYVHTASGPIIESCSRVRFGDYSVLRYDHLQMQMEESELNKVINCFADVKDFKWHKIKKSPNWDLIDDNETVPLSKFEDIVIKGCRHCEGDREEHLGNDSVDDSDDEL